MATLDLSVTVKFIQGTEPAVIRAQIGESTVCSFGHKKLQRLGADEIHTVFLERGTSETTRRGIIVAGGLNHSSASLPVLYAWQFQYTNALSIRFIVHSQPVRIIGPDSMDYRARQARVWDALHRSSAVDVCRALDMEVGWNLDPYGGRCWQCMCLHDISPCWEICRRSAL